MLNKEFAIVFHIYLNQILSIRVFCKFPFGAPPCRVGLRKKCVANHRKHMFSLCATLTCKR